MKKIITLTAALILSACDSSALTTNSTQSKNDCEDISHVFSKIGEHDLFALTPSQAVNVFKSSFSVSDSDIEQWEDIELTYKLRPKYDAWINSPELVYNFHEIENRREFISAHFRMRKECFDHPNDLLKTAQNALGKPSFTSDWDDSVGIFATWDTAIAGKDLLHSITVTASPTVYSIRLRLEQHTPDEP